VSDGVGPYRFTDSYLEPLTLCCRNGEAVSFHARKTS
jgi:hypothetical protein